MTKVGCTRVQTDRAAILLAILAIVFKLVFIFKLEPEFDTSNRYI